MHNVLTNNLCNSFYQNLQVLYNQPNYDVKHIWNLNKTRIQARRKLKARVLAQKCSNQIHSTISMSQKWLNYKYVINATNEVLLRFYAFKGERL